MRVCSTSSSTPFATPVGTRIKTSAGFEPILGFLHAEGAEGTEGSYLRFTTQSSSTSFQRMCRARGNHKRCIEAAAALTWQRGAVPPVGILRHRYNTGAA